MTQETLPLAAYSIPRDGGNDDRDDVEYTVDTPVQVTQQGVATFKLTVNWPTALDNVRVTITLPSQATLGTATISPTQTSQSISQSGNSFEFAHPSAANGDTITYSVPYTADSVGAYSAVFELDADELVGTVTRAQRLDFET